MDGKKAKMKWYKFNNKNPLKQKSSAPTKKAKERAWNMFSKYIRTRDCLLTTGTKEEGICITCRRRKPFKELDAGHFYPGRRNSVLFCDVGTNAQCQWCNRFKDGDYQQYRRIMVMRHGDEWVSNYEVLAKVPKSMTKTDFDNVYMYYKIEFDKLVNK